MRRAMAVLIFGALFGAPLSPASAGPVPTCFGEPATIVGTPDNDELRGTPGRDVIVGLRGRDRIFGGPGRDLICGGPGKGGGDDFEEVFAGRGSDRVSGGLGPDTVVGGAGDDVLIGGARWDMLAGGGGDDRIFGGRTRDDLSGGAGDDTLHGGHEWDYFTIDPGDDVIHGGPDGEFGDILRWSLTPRALSINLQRGEVRGLGRDVLLDIENALGPPSYNDALRNEHADRIVGDEQPNLLDGGGGGDLVLGKGGADCLRSADGDGDALYGGLGSDAIDFDLTCGVEPPGLLFLPDPRPLEENGVTVDLAQGVATDHLYGTVHRLHSIEGAYGTTQSDRFIGDAHDNFFYGDEGDDRLEGGAGDDTLDGESGADEGDGGEGTDSCIHIEIAVSCE